MAAPVLQFKRGLSANLPSLRAGEPGFATDSYDFYVGLTSQSINNKFLTSSRFWTKETATTGSGVNLVEGTNNGSDFITLASPASVGAAVTYYFPPANGSASSVLTNNGSGVLSWASGSANPVFSGIATFSDTTDNTLGNENTGSVQFDGGVGIAKNLTVKNNLHIGGFSEFVGVATFRGGTINLGDSDTDDINVAGEFISNLIPNADATFDIGLGAKRWRHASFSGIGTFATGAVVDNIRIGITAASEIDTSSGDLTLDSAGGQVIIDDNLSVSGVSTFTGLINANSDVTSNTASLNLFNATVTTANVLGAGTALVIGAATGITTIRNAVVDLDGDLNVDGGDVTSNTASLNLFNATATTVNAFGAATAIGIGSTSATLTLRPSTVVGASATQNLYDTTATTVNAFGAATAIGIGSTSATLTLRPSTVVGASATQNLFNTVATTVNAFGAGTALVIGAATGITTIRNATLDLDGDLNVDGGDVTSNTASLNLFNATVTTANVLGAGTALVIGAATGITTVRNNLTVDGDIRVNGNDIQSSDGAANITLTSSTLTTFAGDIKITGNDIQSSSATAITLNGSDVAIAGDLTVTGNDIKSSTATVITLSADDASFVGDVTIGGDLFVNGSTTQVNTTSLTVEDTLIELGFVNGAAPTSDFNKDLGLLLNYFSGTAKKAAVFWDDSTSRIVVAAEVSESTGVLTPTTYAAFEIGSLFVSDCAGSSQVINCVGNERLLENITIDGGSF